MLDGEKFPAVAPPNIGPIVGPDEGEGVDDGREGALGELVLGGGRGTGMIGGITGTV